jgi:hypothetical protein
LGGVVFFLVEMKRAGRSTTCIYCARHHDMTPETFTFVILSALSLALTSPFPAPTTRKATFLFSTATQNKCPGSLQRRAESVNEHELFTFFMAKRRILEANMSPEFLIASKYGWPRFLIHSPAQHPKRSLFCLCVLTLSSNISRLFHLITLNVFGTDFVCVWHFFLVCF